MTNNKSTKRALVSSVMALFLCFAMLLGTTYAWFTDVAVSENNKITAGTLDVDLYQWTDTTTKTEITESAEPVFDANIKWEPGYTNVVYLSIKNNGSLALKYRVAVKVTDVSTHNLADVMEYVLTSGAEYGEVTSWAGNGDKFENAPGMNEITAEDIELLPGEEDFFALSIHMLEEAENKYMGETIAFDIRVIAGQATVESNSFGDDTYDAFANYPGKGFAPALTAGESAREVEVRGDDGYKVGSVVIPKAAASGTPFSVNIQKGYYNANISVDAGLEKAPFDVTVTGLKEDNETPVKVQIKIAEGLDPDTVAVYHYDQLIDSSYNPNSGYVTFESATFSPFTIVYESNSEYVPPVIPEDPTTPVATVTYKAEFVGEGKIEWGSVGGFAPTEGLDSDLDAAFTFACPTELDDAIEAAFEYWYCDFYVSLDKDLGENEIFLGGNYGDFGWIGFHNGDITLAAGEEIGLLEGVTTNPWTYADIRDYVGEFICGVGDVGGALEAKGATFTVKLRLTNPEDASDFYDVNVVKYTFGGDYTIQ